MGAAVLYGAPTGAYCQARGGEGGQQTYCVRREGQPRAQRPLYLYHPRSSSPVLLLYVPVLLLGWRRAPFAVAQHPVECVDAAVCASYAATFQQAAASACCAGPCSSWPQQTMTQIVSGLTPRLPFGTTLQVLCPESCQTCQSPPPAHDPCESMSCGEHGSCSQGNCTCSSGWSGNACETPLSCGVAPSPAHSTGCSGVYTYGHGCTVTCDLGWTSAGGSTSTTFTCGADGHYTGGSLTCERVSCGPAPSPPHSTGCGGENLYGDHCTATCDPGWTAGQTRSVQYMCGQDGTYSPRDSNYCSEVSCGPAPSPTHSSGSCAGVSQTFSSRPCSTRCDPGFSGPSVDWSCGANGQFVASCNTNRCQDGCTECPTDTYKSSEGSHQCQRCPAHSRWASTRPTDFVANSPNVCVCEAGFVASIDAPECAACPSGQYKYDQGKRGDTCTVCEEHSHTEPDPPTGHSTCVCDSGYGKEEWRRGQPCLPAPCPDMTGDFPGMPKHSRPVSVCMGKVFGDQCDLACAHGYTRSTLPRARSTYTCVATGLNGMGNVSEWRGSLDCNPVQCLEFTAPKYAEIVDNTSRISQPTVASSCTGVYGDECLVRCLESFYASDGTRSNRQYTCTAPSIAGPHGTWTNILGHPLACKPGLLSVSASAPDADRWVYEEFSQRTFKGNIDALEGFRMGPSAGPQYDFIVVARDEHNHTRNYKKLQEALVRDYVVASIERVNLDILSPTERALQPHTTDIERDLGVWKEGQVRPYGFSFTSDDQEKVRYVTSDGEDGRWKGSHQFTEHGVFGIAVYLCADDHREPCDNHDDAALVPGTGMPSDSEELEIKSFTVCPQGSRSTSMVDGIMMGSRLSECRAAIGFYSPLGPGRISAYCSTGFTCLYPGTTFPVAEPGYWISPMFNLENKYAMLPELRRCVSIGACPGSVRFLATCPQPGEIGNFEGFEKNNIRRMGQEDCFTISPPSGCVQCPETPSRPGTCTGIGRCCLDIIGSRCCPGSAGASCEECCSGELLESPACRGLGQWHAVGTGEGKHCQPCPPNDKAWMLAVGLTVALLVAAPVLTKLSELIKHAEAVQGPFLSVMNFMQSADLFLGLRLRWPEEFKLFCRSLASFFNFNVMPLLHLFRIPPLECAWSIPYEVKWNVIMCTPFLLVVAMLVLTIISIFCRTLLRRSLKFYAKRFVQTAILVGVCGGACYVIQARLSMISISTRALAFLGVLALCTVVIVCCVFSCCRKKPKSELTVSLIENDHETLTEEDSESLVSDMKLEPTSTQSQALGAGVETNQSVQGSAGCSISRMLCNHDWSATSTNIQRLVLGYLMVGYIFLAQTSLEPLTCQYNLDGRRYMRSAPAIECSLCNDNYKSLYYKAFIGATVYGLGSPLLFFVILYTHRDRLKTHEFTTGYGFLAAKMREEHYIWEVLISFRKLLLVVGTGLSDGHVVASTLWNVFVTVLAFGAQVWTWPFANNDANLAESATLLSTLLVLCLALGQRSSTDSNDDIEVTNDVTHLFNNIIYANLFFFVSFSILVLCRRLAGIRFSLKHSKDYQSTKIQFVRPSRCTRFRITIQSRLCFRARSICTCHTIDQWRHLPRSADVLNVDRHTSAIFMATQRCSAFIDDTLDRQSAIILQGQLVHVCEERVEVIRSVRVRLVRSEYGWVRLKAHDQDREFHSLMIRADDEHMYYKVNRSSTVGTDCEVKKCVRARTTAELFDDERDSDYVIHKNDIVEIKRTKFDTESGHNRLAVVSPIDRSKVIGWISEEREHVLSDDVTTVIHKSKIKPASLWAQAYAEQEDFRRVDRIFARIEAFRTSIGMTRVKSFEQHFPAATRPAIYAWLASAPPSEVADLAWFMEELKLVEDEQLRLLPKVDLSSRCKQVRTKPEKGASVSLPMHVQGSQRNIYFTSRDEPNSSDSDEDSDAHAHVSRVITNTAASSRSAQSMRSRQVRQRCDHVISAALLGSKIRQTASCGAIVLTYALTVFSLANFSESVSSIAHPCQSFADNNTLAGPTDHDQSNLFQRFPWIWLLVLDCIYNMWYVVFLRVTTPTDSSVLLGMLWIVAWNVAGGSIGLLVLWQDHDLSRQPDCASTDVFCDLKSAVDVDETDQSSNGWQTPSAMLFGSWAGGLCSILVHLWSHNWYVTIIEAECSFHTVV